MVDAHRTRLKPHADRHVIIGQGRTVGSGTTPDLDAAPALVQRFPSV